MGEARLASPAPHQLPWNSGADVCGLLMPERADADEARIKQSNMIRLRSQGTFKLRWNLREGRESRLAAAEEIIPRTCLGS